MLKKMLDYLNKQKFVYEFSMDEETYYTNKETHIFIRGEPKEITYPKEITSEIEIYPSLDGKKFRNWIMEGIRSGNYQKVSKVVEFEDDGEKIKVDGRLLLRLESDGPNYYYIKKLYYELFKSKKYDMYIPDHWHWTHNLLVVESGKPLDIDNVIGGVTAMRITGDRINKKNIEG